MKIGETWTEQLKHIQNKKHYLQFYKYKCGRGLCEPPKKWLFYPGTGWYIMVNPLRYLQAISNKYISEGEYKTYKKWGLILPKYNDFHNWFYYNFDGESFNPNLSKYAFMYTLFDKIVDWKDKKIICEIGSGYGGMAELVLLNTEISKYILIDLPEVLEIAKTYLKATEVDINRLKFIDIYEYGKEKNSFSHVDVFLNSDSFVEMLPDTVADYFDFMQKFKNTYLLSCNRTEREESGYFTSELTLPYDTEWTTVLGQELKRDNQPDVFVRISKR